MKVPKTGADRARRISVRVLTFLAGVLTGQEMVVPGLVRLISDLL